MRTNRLTEDKYALFQLSTRKNKKQLRPDYACTDWTPNNLLAPDENGRATEYHRILYDSGGPWGYHMDWVLMAQVQWAPESGCWRWMAITHPGSRYGLSRTETTARRPRIAMSMVDAQLELYCLFENEFRNKANLDNTETPFVEPLLHPTRPWRLLTWHSRYAERSVGASYLQRWIRPWVYTDEAQAALPAMHRSDLWVQRTQPKANRPGACVTVRKISRTSPENVLPVTRAKAKRTGTYVEWSVNVPPHAEAGFTSTVEEAFACTERTLELLNAKTLRARRAEAQASVQAK